MKVILLFYCLNHPRLSYFTWLIVALGAIFSATDSVCTLQVHMYFKGHGFVYNIEKTSESLKWNTKNSSFWCLNTIFQVLNQDETPLLYSLVFGEGVVNDATSVVLFNAIQKFGLSHITPTIAMQFIGSFLYLFLTSTFLGLAVSLYLFSSYLVFALQHTLNFSNLILLCHSAWLNFFTYILTPSSLGSWGMINTLMHHAYRNMLIYLMRY